MSDAEQFVAEFEARMRDAAQRAAVKVGAEAVLLALGGLVCNFGASHGMAPADIVATLRAFADEIEANASAIAAHHTSH